MKKAKAPTMVWVLFYATNSTKLTTGDIAAAFRRRRNARLARKDRGRALVGPFRYALIATR